MEQINFVHVGAALLGGGAMGAIISTIVSSYRARVQPVGERIEVLPIFSASGSESSLRAQISITHDGSAATFENLFVAEIQVVNRGNQDLERFEFGATFSEGDRCIYVDAKPPDRHHSVSQPSAPTPQVPTQEVDFVLAPFNRRDSYSFQVYLVIPDGSHEPGAITLGSPSPIRFVEMPTMGELLADFSQATIQIGPLRFGIDR